MIDTASTDWGGHKFPDGAVEGCWAREWKAGYSVLVHNSRAPFARRRDVLGRRCMAHSDG
jgi:hypothetical protein